MGELQDPIVPTDPRAVILTLNIIHLLLGTYGYTIPFIKEHELAHFFV